MHQQHKGQGGPCHHFLKQNLSFPRPPKQRLKVFLQEFLEFFDRSRWIPRPLQGIPGGSGGRMGSKGDNDEQ